MKKTLILALATGMASIVAPHAATQKGEKAIEAGQPHPMVKLLDAPLLFVKRHSYSGIHIYDTFYKWPPGGGGIYILENPSAPKAKWKIRPVINETSPNTLGKGVYSQPELSWDAKKLVFCYKGQPNGSTSIYEIGVDGEGLRRLTDPTETLSCYKGSHAGQHDVDPSYLPDGRIVFTSTRSSGLVPCANSGVAILHVMDSDGKAIHPISVNSETEFDPTVLPDGRIAFGRWEYVDKNALTVQSLWTIYPDGTRETAVFANNMVLPEATLDIRPVPGSRLLAATLAKHNHTPRGSVAMIDPYVGKNDPKAIFNFEHPKNPTYDLGDSCEPYPINSDSLIFSGRPKGYRRNVIEMMNRKGDRVTLLSDPAICLHSPMLVKPRPKPTALQDLVDPDKKTGAFFVQDVYDGLDGVERGEAKWLRVIEETSRVSASPGTRNPFNQTFLVSAAMAFAIKNYQGIVPINADGSIYFEAPSGRALYFQVLDKDKRLIQSMRTFVQAAPGITRSCIGCHEKKSNAPGQGRRLNVKTLSQKPARLMPESWGTGYMDYTSMVQPVWDRNCVSCHGGKKGIAGRLDLSGGWTQHFNISYENLVDRRETQLIAHLISGIDCMNGTAHWSCQLFKPRSHGSAVAPLAEAVMSGHKGRIRNMTEGEKDLVMAWIDSNGLYYGNWDYTAHGYGLACWNGIRGRLAAEMTKANCYRCHDRYFANDWVNLREPKLSRILRAPLAKGEEGNGLAVCRNHKVDPRRNRIRLLRNNYAHAVKPISAFAKQPVPPIQDGGASEPTFASTGSPHYQSMLNIIRQGRRQALSTPRIDMPGAEAIAGKSRMFIPPPLPETAPTLHVAVDADGVVNLNWERSASTIGLSSELHRGSEAGFTPGKETLLVGTALFEHRDREAPEGQQHYALVLLSGEKRSKPSRATVLVTPPKPPAIPTDLEAKPTVGAVQLTWTGSNDPSVRYLVYRKKGTGGDFERITASGLAEFSYSDPSVEPEEPYSYAVRSISRRGAGSDLTSCVTTAALPEIRDALFSASFSENAGAALYGGGIAEGQLNEKAVITDEALDVQQGGYAVFAHRPEFDLTRKLSMTCRVKIVKENQMPVIISCGRWRQAGWFLQRIGTGWRWHVGGIDCDGGAPALGEWTEITGTYDGKTARLFQDGKLVADVAGSANRAPWNGALHVGQYSGGPGPAYQVIGQISNLEIYGCALSAQDIANRTERR